MASKQKLNFYNAMQCQNVQNNFDKQLLNNVCSSYITKELRSTSTTVKEMTNRNKPFSAQNFASKIYYVLLTFK